MYSKKQVCYYTFATIIVIALIAVSWFNNAPVNAQEPEIGHVTTYAGVTGVAGYADGPSGSALFNLPRGVAVDNAGNVYVADSINFVVRKIDLAGNVTTIAGKQGVSKTIDGPFGVNRLGYPRELEVDNHGNIYVVETDTHAIRKIDPTGYVTTIAGLPGTSGSADGLGSAARFYRPRSITVDNNTGDLYVADAYNHTIRKIDPTGYVTTFAGQAGTSGTTDGPVSVARFYYPTSTTFDDSGNLYVADNWNHTIRKIDPDLNVTTVAGQPGVIGSADGQGSAATFYRPSGIVWHNGNLYIADSYNANIRMMDPAGNVITLAGLAGVTGSADGTGTDARFDHPVMPAMDNLGNFYVADRDNHVIRKVTFSGGEPVGCYAGSPENVFQGDVFTLTLRCDSISEQVFGFQAGHTITEGDTLVTAQASSYTAGDVFQGQQVLEGSNTLELYGLSLQAGGTEATGDFTLGSVDYSADFPGQATFDLINLILGDINGDEIPNSEAPQTWVTVTIGDLILSLSGTVDPEGFVSAENLELTLAGEPVYDDLQKTLNPDGTIDFVFTGIRGQPGWLWADGPSHVTCEKELFFLQDAGHEILSGELVLRAGDVNSDEAIDITDATAIGLAYGDPASGELDINNDGIVNILDLIHVGRNYDITGPTDCSP